MSYAGIEKPHEASIETSSYKILINVWDESPAKLKTTTVLWFFLNKVKNLCFYFMKTQFGKDSNHHLQRCYNLPMGSFHKFDLLYSIVISSVARWAVHTDGALVIAATAPAAPETHKYTGDKYEDLSVPKSISANNLWIMANIKITSLHIETLIVFSQNTNLRYIKLYLLIW